jgi:hypothetical protein
MIEVERLRSARDTAAVLVAACALVAVAWPERPPPSADCIRPYERIGRDGWSRDVGCGERAAGRALRGPARLLFCQTLDLNRASAAALESLPGIGAGRAEAIVRERDRERFASLAALERVRGIGPRTVAGLEGWAHASADPAHIAVSAAERELGCVGGL